ncbi:MAG: LPS-assembly protein LptD [Sphingomicrobium sp.]|nr:LPS assembly protein LptD [Sphingomonadales bacterium]
MSWTALPLLLAVPGAAWAQTGPAQPTLTPAPPTAVPTAAADPSANDSVIDFAADMLSYDNERDLVTANGSVRLARDGNYLAADQVSWDRKTGKVQASGNVVVLDPQGNKLIGEKVDLTDTLKDGTIDNLLLVLDTGGRVAATRGSRVNGATVLDNAIYTGCPVTEPCGKAKRPSWTITAARVTRSADGKEIRFSGGRLNVLGVSLPLLPIFVVHTDQVGTTGALIPDLSYSASNGFEITLPYHLQFAPNRDATITPHIYTGNAPAIEARYRKLTRIGAFQVGGFLTYGRVDSSTTLQPVGHNAVRGYFEANGKAQFDPYWSLTVSVRAATDKTVTRRYDLTRDDRLRSFADLERITPNSYISIAGWAFQGLRVDDRQRAIPIALPAIDARFRVPDPVLGGRVELQANSLAILRLDGQDTQRAFVQARWDLRKLTAMGQQLTFTALGRGDVYHTDDSASTLTALYRGVDGWHARAIGALAADARWPLVGPAFGGTQMIIPRVQVVLTPPTPNLSFPNEDSRSIDLDDSNLFAINRFSGYDRWEDGSRVTYGAEYSLERPRFSLSTVIGQSYRLSRSPSLFPEGTGLTDRFSDIVGRTRIRYGRFLDITNRFRLDKTNFAVRRNELDLTVGSDQTYLQVGYLRLNRNVDPAIEDLRDKEELRLAGRWKFRRYWSLFGATVVDLTNKGEDPLSLASGFEPVRHRLGIDYEDDCLIFGVQWRRDYERIGTFRKGSTFALHFALKNLGR